MSVATITLSGSTLLETATPGMVIGTLGVNGGANGEVFTYALADSLSDRFEIIQNPTSGDWELVVKTAGSDLFDFETDALNHFDIAITATGDQQTAIDPGAFTLQVSNVNEAPTGANLSANAVAENTGTNAEIGTLSAIDADLNDTFTFTLTDDAGGRFKLDASGTKLLVADGSKLDYEGAGSHEIKVLVTDAGGLTVEKTLTINVTNVNEAPSDIKLSTLSAPSVAEGTATGTEIGALSALDPDMGDTFTFTLKDDAQGRFKLDATGKKLLVADSSKLDYEAAASHQIKLEVKDAGGMTFEKTLTISVADGVDTFLGTKRNDTLVGTNGMDKLMGDAGNDKLYGLDGDDVLNGGLGKDFLYGGKGKDTFLFNSPVKKGQFDQVMDFNAKDDTLEFSLSSSKSFKIKGMKAGKLNKKFFTIGDHAKDKNDYIYYKRTRTTTSTITRRTASFISTTTVPATRRASKS
jgi:serralysin